MQLKLHVQSTLEHDIAQRSVAQHGHIVTTGQTRILTRLHITQAVRITCTLKKAECVILTKANTGVKLTIDSLTCCRSMRDGQVVRARGHLPLPVAGFQHPGLVFGLLEGGRLRVPVLTLHLVSLPDAPAVFLHPLKLPMRICCHRQFEWVEKNSRRI